MIMIAQFVRSVILFMVPDQIVEEEDNIVHDRFKVVAELPLPLIE